MGARWVDVKTGSTLPKHEEAGEQNEERRGQLLEYQLCKEMAAKVLKKREGIFAPVREMAVLPVNMVYEGDHQKDELLSAYFLAAGKAKRRLPPSPTDFSGIVSKRIVSVTSRILFILRKLYETGEVSYKEFFYS